MRQRLRFCWLAIAVIASGLALGAVAPAPPAAAADEFMLTQGETSVRASGGYSMCEQTVSGHPNPHFRYFRRFHLADHGVPAGGFNLLDIRFGVARVFDEGFAEVRVDTIAADDPTMTLADLVPLATMRVLVTHSDENSVVQVPSNVDIADASKQDLVISVRSGTATSEGLFAMGGSYRPETMPSYIVAPHCGFPEITNTDMFDFRSDPVIFASGWSIDPTPPPQGPPITPDDLDGDGFLNAADSCPSAYARDFISATDAPGCYELFVRVYPDYAAGVVSGRIDGGRYDATPWTRPTHVEGVCNAPTQITVWQYEDTDGDPDTPWARTTKLGEALSDAGGSFAVAVGHLPRKTHYAVVTPPYGPVAGKVYCNSMDNHWEGPTIRTVAEPVERSVTAEYHHHRVSGRVTVLDPPDDAPDACIIEEDRQWGPVGLPVDLMLRSSDADDVYLDSALVGPDGSFSIPHGPLPPGTTLYVRAESRDFEREGFWCLGADSAIITAVDDEDDDGVHDPVDRCPAVSGPDGGAFPGCPVVAQVVTARVVSGVVSGAVSAPAGVNGACSQQTGVQVQYADTGQPVRSDTTSGEGRAYSISVADVPEGARLQVKADGFFDPGSAFCLIGESDVRVKGDDDSDGVVDSADFCPSVPGPSGGPLPGCPTLRQDVTVAYEAGVVTGEVTVTRPSGVPSSACSGPTTVEVLRVPATGQRVSYGEVDASGDSYSLEIGAVDDGTQIVAMVYGYLDVGNALCGAGQSEVLDVVRDADDDGVRDRDDGCDQVASPAGGRVRGCPDLQREVSASYAAGVVSGAVSFADADVPDSACSGVGQRLVQVWLQFAGEDFGSELLAEGRSEVGTGRYSIEVALEPGSFYRVYAREGLDPDAGYCSFAESGERVVPVVGDADADGFPDNEDSCPEVRGIDDAEFPGCPTLAREVSAAYAGGVLSGVVSAPDASGCARAEDVRVYPLLDEAGTRGVPEVVRTSGDGSFSVDLATLEGSRFVVVAHRFLDGSGLGVCAGAESEIVETWVDRDGDGLENAVDVCPGSPAPISPVEPEFEGCPTLARTVSAAYAGERITGQVSVLGPNPAPSGACLPTLVRAVTVRSGVAVQVGATTATAADGSYTIVLGGGLAAGSTYYVATARYLHDEMAVCGAAESARGQVTPVVDPPVDPPGGSVPGDGVPGPALVAPALSGVKLTKRTIHVVGSRVRPRATALKLRLNVAATTVITLEGTSKASGKKVTAKVFKTLAAGASSIKLTGKIGRLRLPPGTYRVTLRATNTAGTDTASAGRFTIRP